MRYRFEIFALVGFIALALGACSSNSGNTLGNPLSGVTVVNYTPAPSTPSPTPTAAPTATPTLAPNATPTPTPSPGNVIVDGGFEAEGAANNTFTSWTPCSYLHPVSGGTPIPAITTDITDAVISASDPSFTVGKASAPIATVTPSADSGTYAALTYTGTGAISVTFPPATGPAVPSGSYPAAGANGICQTFVVPTAASFTLDTNEGGNESAGYGDQEATLFVGGISALAAASPSPITVFNELNTQNSSSFSGGWKPRGPYNLTAAPFSLTPGTTVTLFLGTFDTYPSSEYGEYMFVDNVSVFGGYVTPAGSAAPNESSARKRSVFAPTRR